MFTGIIETFGEIKEIIYENDNVHFWIESKITSELKIDQSVSHNGICLTVVSINDSLYKVTAIKETIKRTTIKDWKTSDIVNLERAMLLGSRLDGHIVQGHVDQTAICTSIEDANGSIYFSFVYDFEKSNITIEKGSITIDGTSLTVVDSGKNTFSVAIIPYTLENTLFKTYKIGSEVNLEFDVVGKYVSKIMRLK